MEFDFKLHMHYNEFTGELTYKSGTPVDTTRSHGYKWVIISGKWFAQHRIAWFLKTGFWPKHEIDHISRNRADNRWINLREATHGQNAQNRGVHKNNKLKIRGIRHRPIDGFYEPRIMKDGKAIYLGIFKNLDDAIAARKNAELEYFTHGSI